MPALAPAREPRPDRVAELARSIEQPFTVGTLLRAAERDHHMVSHVLTWLREASTSSASRTW